MLEKVIDLIFPPKCGFCKKINKQYLCKKCELKLNYLKQDKIEKIKNKDYSYLLYAYEYKDEIRNKILDFKFNDKPELSETFVKVLLNNEKICRFLESYDIIIPVPMHRKKLIFRGYNQTDLIAKKLAQILHLEYVQALVKCKNTNTQSSLNAENRRINVKGAYECGEKQKIYNKKIIIFDDIYTTGSTAEECAKQLKKTGALEIAVLVIAKD